MTKMPGPRTGPGIPSRMPDPDYKPYRPFHYFDQEVEVCVRPEEARGWQMYQELHHWLVHITLKGQDFMKVRFSGQERARDFVGQLADFIADEAARAAHNAMQKRKSDG